MGWRIGELLVKKKWILWDQLQEALEAQRTAKLMLGEILVQKNWVPKYYVYRALAEQNDMQFVDLKQTHIEPRAIDLIPMEFALTHKLIPIDICAGKMILGISNPINHWPEEAVRQLTGMISIETVLCLPEHIEEAIREEYGKLEHPVQELPRK